MNVRKLNEKIERDLRAAKRQNDVFVQQAQLDKPMHAVGVFVIAVLCVAILSPFIYSIFIMGSGQ